MKYIMTAEASCSLGSVTKWKGDLCFRIVPPVLIKGTHKINHRAKCLEELQTLSMIYPPVLTALPICCLPTVPELSFLTLCLRRTCLRGSILQASTGVWRELALRRKGEKNLDKAKLSSRHSQEGVSTKLKVGARLRVLMYMRLQLVCDEI